MLGGALTQAFSWRATFYFLAALTAIFTLAFLFFEDTFRRERSAVYVGTLKRRRQEREKKGRKLEELHERQQNGSRATVDQKVAPAVQDEKKPSPESLENATPVLESLASSTEDGVFVHEARADDSGTGIAGSLPVKEIRLSLRDVNPIRPMITALRRPTNIPMIIANGAYVLLLNRIPLLIDVFSGIIFGFGYSIAYTSARTLGNQYGYGALQIGLVLLAFGIGALYAH